jgi:hypothetical protein
VSASQLRFVLGALVAGSVAVAGCHWSSSSLAGSPKPDGGLAAGVFIVTPSNKVLDVLAGQPLPTQQFTALLRGKSVDARWTVDSPWLGSIDSNGVFTPVGVQGGTATVTASIDEGDAAAPVTVHVHAQSNGATSMDPESGAGGYGGVGGEGLGGPVDAPTQKALQMYPTDAPGLSWLYPYDGTIWPLGVRAPLLQWQPPAGVNYDAVYIHLTEANFEYAGFFARTATPFIHHPIPQDVWSALMTSNRGEMVQVVLVFSAGGVAYGPLTQTWQITPKTLPGTIYYQSYGTRLAQNYSGPTTYNGQTISFGGATLGIQSGATAPILVAGSNTECRVCHSVSADGSTLVTQRGDNYAATNAFALAKQNTETPLGPANGQFTFPALYPDGSLLFSGSVPVSGSPSWGWASSLPSALFSVSTAAPVPGVQGLPDGLGGSTPTFSPDGKHVAFNFFRGRIGGQSGDGRSLAVMDFDKASLTFSNPRVLFTPPVGIAVWPAFLPTNDGVIFELEVQSNGRDFAGTRPICDSADDPSGCADRGTRAELWWVDLRTQTPRRLDALNGVNLPVGANAHDNDTQLNYEPTISPDAAGGFAWVVFTSRRMYGNVAIINPFWSDPRFHDLTASPTPKKLWVAAIDLNAPAGTDPSHPAFYLPAQELLAGNSRGFWGRTAVAGSHLGP